MVSDGDHTLPALPGPVSRAMQRPSLPRAQLGDDHVAELAANFQHRLVVS